VAEAVKAEWAGNGPPDERTIHRWLLHMFPIAVEEDWERLRQSLAAAGAPVEDERFGAW
jgi:hypothetical protein